MPKIPPRKEGSEHPLYRAAMAAQHLAYQLMREVPAPRRPPRRGCTPRSSTRRRGPRRSWTRTSPARRAAAGRARGVGRLGEGAARPARAARGRRGIVDTLEKGLEELGRLKSEGESERSGPHAGRAGRVSLGARIRPSKNRAIRFAPKSGRSAREPISFVFPGPQHHQDDQEQEDDEADDDRGRARRAGGRLGRRRGRRGGRGGRRGRLGRRGGRLGCSGSGRGCRGLRSGRRGLHRARGLPWARAAEARATTTGVGLGAAPCRSRPRASSRSSSRWRS